jgi:peptidyl-prolyl cis-trans isomerase SurA
MTSRFYFRADPYITPRARAAALATLVAFITPFVAVPAHAQGLKPSQSLSPLQPQQQPQTLQPLQPGVAAPGTPPRAVTAPAGQQRAADFIVVVVNSEPITNSEVRVEAQRLAQQYAQQRRPLPSNDELVQSVLDRMISDKVQLQLARDNGIRIEDVAVDQAEQNVARQNKMEVPELRRQLAADGIALAQFREQLREQLSLVRLREREVDSRLRVSDLEVEQFRREQEASNDLTNQEINIAQILVAVPDAATPQQVAALEAKAQAIQVRARAREDFATLARELSDSADRANGGQLGSRTAERLPALFVDATQGQPVGSISGVLRSGAGFHILKVLERRTVIPTVPQARARHILLRASPKLTEAAARDKLIDYKRRIESGQADFAALARENSQDASAAQGGDLGWSSPGQFVPEFEEVVNALTPGQVSEPLISRFGVHLIQVMERRNNPLSQRDQNEILRSTLREKKLDEAYTIWARDLRGRAYIEMRESPQI